MQLLNSTEKQYIQLPAFDRLPCFNVKTTITCFHVINIKRCGMIANGTTLHTRPNDTDIKK